MYRLYLKIAILSFILLAAVMLLIRAQPYDDHDLRALLIPSDCVMPCFMGVRPGETSFNHALAVLDAQGAVGRVTVSTYYYVYGAGKIIQWLWDGSESDVLKASWTDHTSLMQEQGGIIIEIDIPTNITLGDVWLTLGRPSQSDVDQIADLSLQGNHLYPQFGLQTEGQIRCPLSLDAFWRTPQTLTFFASDGSAHPPNRADLPEFLQKLKDRFPLCRS